MTNYGVVKSFNRPKDIEITSTSILLASNITPCELEVGDSKI